MDRPDVRRRSLPSRTEAVSQLIAIGPLLNRVHTGHSLETDDVDLDGQLNADAKEAEEEIQDILDRTVWWTQD